MAVKMRGRVPITQIKSVSVEFRYNYFFGIITRMRTKSFIRKLSFNRCVCVTIVGHKAFDYIGFGTQRPFQLALGPIISRYFTY